jgi:hypothetical protein
MTSIGTHRAAQNLGQFPQSLCHLGFVTKVPQSAPRPARQRGKNMTGPRMFLVAALQADEYMAVTSLKTCTGLAVYDATVGVSGLYHFGGHFGNETTELDTFFQQLSQQGTQVARMEFSLSGSMRCKFSGKLLTYLQGLPGYVSQHVSVYQTEYDNHGEASVFLLAGGKVAHTLT